MKKLTLVVIFASIGVGLFAQDFYLNDSIETQELSFKVVKLFSENEISKSFDVLTPYWPLPENEIEAIEEKSIKYLNILKDRYGDPIGIEKIKIERIKEIAIRETYLIRYEYTAIRLIFTYYKNDSGWIINAFKWDDSFTEEFK